MKKEIKMLILHLKKETDLFQEMKALILKQREAILDRNMEELGQITRLENNILVKIKKEEDARQGVSRVIAGLLDLETGKMTISEIINRVPRDLEEALKEEQSQLDVVMSQISTNSSINNQLLKDNMEFIQYEMQMLTDISDQAIYSGGRRHMKPAIFDRMI